MCVFATKPEDKCVIVLDDTLSGGFAVNAASVIALTIGREVDAIIGPEVLDGSGETHVGITTTPVPVLKARAEILSSIRDQAVSLGLFVVDFSDAAQQTRTYTDYTALIGTRKTDELTYLAVGLFGSKKLVNKLTGSLALLR
jgi:hypothetical protein